MTAEQFVKACRGVGLEVQTGLPGDGIKVLGEILYPPDETTGFLWCGLGLDTQNKYEHDPFTLLEKLLRDNREHAEQMIDGLKWEIKCERTVATRCTENLNLLTSKIYGHAHD